MAFGVFDLLHDGHIHFLVEAKKYGEKLIVALATDEIVLHLKGRFPHNSLLKRTENLSRLGLVDRIIVGDSTLGDWQVIERNQPDTVALGYDQISLTKELRIFLKNIRKPIKLVMITPHKNQTLHSSNLRAKMLK